MVNNLLGIGVSWGVASAGKCHTSIVSELDGTFQLGHRSCPGLWPLSEETVLASGVCLLGALWEVFSETPNSWVMVSLIASRFSPSSSFSCFLSVFNY